MIEFLLRREKTEFEKHLSENIKNMNHSLIKKDDSMTRRGKKIVYKDFRQFCKFPKAMKDS